MAKLLLLLWLLLVTAITSGYAAAVVPERNTITHIKGFDGPLPFSLETGYVEVEETHGVELFYYFIQSERNPQEDPLILWISGGPGCSGLNALFFDIGPLKLDVAAYNTEGLFPRLIYFEDSWTKVSNVIFLDAPVGTGFSYAREAQGLNVSITGTGRQVRIFLQRWFLQHPEFASNPLYIGGDSYSGITVPVTTLEMANHNSNGELNLKGYMVGNGLTDKNCDDSGRFPFMHGMGLISDELYEGALGSCVGDLVSTPKTTECAQALQAISEATSDINPMHILEPLCEVEYLRHSTPTRIFATRLLVQEENDELGSIFARTASPSLPVDCRASGYYLSDIWANDAEVQEMLGIREGSVGIWRLCPTLLHLRMDVHNTIPYHRNLTQRGYRALVYNGDHDLVITFVGTQAWIRTLGYPVVAPWRPWYSNRQPAGFTTEYAYNLTYATVKGGGHMAPESRPKECLHMIEKWTSPAGRL
ncbi:hypothetical protein ACQ4PT_028845 [Festuca glaucescens]